MQTYLVQPNSKGKIKFISLLLEGNKITKEWGVIGGKIQTKPSEYKIKNLGKRNEVSAEDTALAEIMKIIKTKEKEGYKQTDSLNNLPDFDDPFETLDLDDINTGFCCSKPIKKITETEIDNIIYSGSDKVFVKYNGGCHYIVIDSNSNVKVFTRRWDDHTTKYPAIIKAVENRAFPPTTMLIVELCIDPSLKIDHMTAFKLFSSISKTDTLKGKCKPSQEASLALQSKYQVKAAVFAYLYYGGEQLWHLPYGDILSRIQVDFNPLSSADILFMPQEVKTSTGASLLALAKKHKKAIEGFILWDTTKAMEVTMNGKPKRKAAWKIKVRGEMEVIAVDGEEGKVPGEYGSIHIGRYDAKGKFISMGTVSGLKDEEKKPMWWDFPCVIEVGYDNQFVDTGALQFGTFLKVHEDKYVKDVDLFHLVKGE